jgi:hypothetical protein
MYASTHPKRLALVSRGRLLALATLITGVLVTGCGGGSGTPTAPAVTGASTGASRATSAGSPWTSAGPPNALAESFNHPHH